MFFRRPKDNHERRLRALGYLLDRRGYERDGLCILAVGDGFEVAGLGVPPRGAAYDLAARGERISDEELADALARLRD
jgi:hypothetical protein